MGKIPIWCRTYTATWTHKGQLSWLWVSKRNNTRRMSCLPDLSQGCVLSHRMYHHVLLLIILFYTLFEYELLVVGLGLGGVFCLLFFFMCKSGMWLSQVWICLRGTGKSSKQICSLLIIRQQIYHFDILGQYFFMQFQNCFSALVSACWLSDYIGQGIRSITSYLL